MAVRGSLQERFFRYVSPEPNSGCWLWDGACFHNGYAAMYADGGSKKATHVSLALAGRPRPGNELALHKCDVRSCVNPDHLYWGTPAENTRDMISRGRARMQESRKEFCKRGHPLVEGNLYYFTGGRSCRACEAERKANRRRR